MGIINSPPPTTTNATVFRRRLSQTTTFCPTCSSTGIFFTFSYNFVGHIKSVNFKCQAILKPYEKDVLQHIEMPFVEEDHAIKNYVKSIKSIFGSVDDGVISPSAYDTAWVALIEGVNEQSGGPQFPSSLEWIANHQLLDGSWGESMIFSISDRLVNTLACVIALTTWKVHPDKCKKGLNFVEDNIYKLGDQNEEHKTHGLELVFPALIELAGKLDLKVPNDSPVIKEMYKRRERKLLKIPKEKVHKTPTIMLISLEGMKDLEWDKLLKLQCTNGSFLCSPAATASAFMQTKDQNCLTYLTNLVAKFNGGVPHTYPIDMFEHIWIVDRLQRLGIAHYFRSEIKDCVAYIYRYWDEHGIGFARNCNVPDLDDTAMAFRILRMNGYQVSPDVFRHFVKDREFVCYPGQSRETVTVMLNLYRASQMIFPGEKILNDAKSFSHTFLTEKQLTNELLDRWIITKDLGGEVKYALDVPWYASLPRLETRYYLEQYGGEDDVWIAKTLYRMGNISNNKYLEMAKLDYNHCQAIHQREWSHIQKWSAHPKIEESLKTRLLWSYYEAAASIFEPERCIERFAWVKTTVLIGIINSFFTTRSYFTNADMRAFVDEFINPQHHKKDGKPWHVVLEALHDTLKQISSEAHVALGIDIHPHLYRAWTSWLLRLQEQGNHIGGEAELIVQVINISSGRWLAEEPLSHPQYQLLSSITNNLCNQISRKEKSMVCSQFESKMQELVQLVLCDSSHDLDADLKGTFLTVAKTFYYKAYFDPESINCHIGRVLFENVI
uniref:ent-kaurene synthase n=1 Tax=Artemisia annua TaxID=35608 RepID=A0A8B0RIU6_ARTAN|nr:CPS5 [Artemisia annua]